MATTTASTPQNRRSQPRVTRACRMCKIKKAKCAQTMPCRNCESHGWTCVYEKTNRAGSPISHGTKRSHDQQAGFTMDSETPNAAEVIAEGLRAQKGWDMMSGPSPSTTVESDERLLYKTHTTPVPYVTPRDDDNGQDGDTGNASHENQEEIEPLRDVNEHTTGREYYGRSSNFALLGQLFAHARSNLPTGGNRTISQQSDMLTTAAISEGTMRNSILETYRPAVERQPTGKSPLGTDRLSIVNLLYDDETSIAEPNPKLAVTPGEKPRPTYVVSARSHLQNSNTDPDEIAVTDDLPAATSAKSKRVAPAHPFRRETFLTNQASDNFGRTRIELAVEKDYLRIFFNNLYYIHPFLSQTQFSARCETTIWSRWPLTGIPRGDLHFLALYNVILAVGSLIGSDDTFTDHKKQLDHDLGGTPSDIASATSSIQLSRIFLDRSKRLLGDCFEVCSLESAQTLILMSLYWQNALNPHACYMYSGMAVRTALAIGLPDASIPQSVEWQNSAKKTWWAIYSQEVDMCCSSGRMSSLMTPSSYDISFPETNGITNHAQTSTEAEYVAIIPEMVKFAALLLRASKEVHYDGKHLSMPEKSKIAFDLDVCFTEWRNNLPSWLSPSSNALKEPEWVSKQKLVLELRYQNAKIVLHRPFVAACATQQPPVFGANVDVCLTAARRTISLLYESYLHRHYFRSWRYNTTYTIYAATIILYLILLDYSVVSTDDLLADVKKSLDILASMDEARVARRCFDLIQELLEFAQNHVQRRQRFERHNTQLVQFPNPMQPVVHRYGMDSGVEAHQGFSNPSQLNANDGSWATNPSMSGIMASMMDPIALEGFVVGNEPIGGMVYEDFWLGGDMVQ